MDISTKPYSREESFFFFFFAQVFDAPCRRYEMWYRTLRILALGLLEL
jgi:hypothetical protein